MIRSSQGRYYQIRYDMEDYPNAWCYVAVGGRRRGKTYGALTKYLDDDAPTIFLRRTNDDVRLLCSGNSLAAKTGDYEIDLSPYKSINRDRGTKIKAFKIDEGIGAFYHVGSEGQATGSPVSYLLSLNANKKTKGFDLSECEAMIFDEFIPMFGERTSRKEGELVLDLYMTASRDRISRGRGDLKLLLLANATDIYNPMFAVLEIVDVVAEMLAKGKEILYLEDKGILIHVVPEGDAKEENERSGIYKAMKNTAWGRVSFGNEFAYNDFSRIRKLPMKGFRTLAKFHYKNDDYYLHVNDEGIYYANASRQDWIQEYDLNQELSAKSFYYDHVSEVVWAGTEGRAYFSSYVLYDLFTNYKQRFKT